MKDTTTPILLLRVCPIHKKRTWHLTAGKRDDVRLCVDCIGDLLQERAPVEASAKPIRRGK